jgi:hypothetical protein
LTSVKTRFYRLTSFSFLFSCSMVVAHLQRVFGQEHMAGEVLTAREETRSRKQCKASQVFILVMTCAALGIFFLSDFTMALKEDEQYRTQKQI